MLVHICCSVDSHYFLAQLQKDYPDEKLIGFFYDPNIHPYSEYRLRLYDVKYSCDILGIELIEGEYDFEQWLTLTKGLEDEPEKGARCNVCFDRRLEVTVQKAVELGERYFTTTLLMSPKKSQEKLETIAQKLALEYECKFVFKNYRIKNGVELQGKEVKKYNIYRQNYCGCMFALNKQRNEQNKLTDELFSPINKQILPESIESRLELYKERTPNSDIIKQRFLNYRVLSAKVEIEKRVVNSYFLCYSTLNKNKTSGKIVKTIDNIAYLNKDEVKLISLEYFNTLANTNYNTTLELVYNPPKFDAELKIREKIVYSSYDLSCVIVLDILPSSKLTIWCDSKIYEDVRDVYM